MAASPATLAEHSLGETQFLSSRKSFLKNVQMPMIFFFEEKRLKNVQMPMISFFEEKRLKKCANANDCVWAANRKNLAAAAIGQKPLCVMQQLI